jgi:hypothetical protein
VVQALNHPVREVLESGIAAVEKLLKVLPRTASFPAIVSPPEDEIQVHNQGLRDVWNFRFISQLN